MTHEYYDKNGDKIEAGMILAHDDGSFEKIFPCSIDGDEDDRDLGFDANNYNSPGLTTLMFYPLSQFDLAEWTILATEITPEMLAREN